MEPTRRFWNKKIAVFAWILAISLTVLCIGPTYGRRIDWASAELVYHPPAAVTYGSDCLTEEGQEILLSDWNANQTERTVTIRLTRPAGAETEPDELTVTPDALAAQHLAVQGQVTQNQIVITLTRLPEAPGLAQTATMKVSLSWRNLSGTICFDMLPYGDMAEPVPTPEEVTREVNTNLTQVKISDTIHPQRQVVCVMLNLETKSDFAIFATVGTSHLYKVRWSTDGGQSWKLFYDMAQLEIPYPYPENWDGVVLLDMTGALEPEVQPIVGVEATGYDRYECKPVYQALPQPVTPVLKTGEATMVLPVATKWGAATMELLGIQRLTEDQDGNLTYSDYNALRATVIDGGIRMEPVRQDQLPPSGSYRIQVQWRWNGICLDRQSVWFFINTN